MIPDLIEIVPLTSPVRAEITVPGSKSITNRALILSALAEAEVTLQGALWSEDTQIMVEALRQLGFELRVEVDAEEFCNRTITVKGLGGRIPNAGRADAPLELFVGNAGTAARFLAALVCLGNGVYRLHGVPRMHERPQQALFGALRELGYRVESSNDKLPALVHGGGPRVAKCQVSVEDSSQFASGLMLCAATGKWDVQVTGENAEESPYVTMTASLMKAFPSRGGRFQIEPDTSSGAYFYGADSLALQPEGMEYSTQFGIEVPTTDLQPIRVAKWPTSGWQVDQRFPEVLARNLAFKWGLDARREGKPEELVRGARLWQGFKKVAQEMKQPVIAENCAISRSRDLGDSIMLAIVLSPFAFEPVRFTDLGRLRLQECERVMALRTELTRCGAKVVEQDDTLTVFPSELHGAEIEPYNDHRMAMCFSVLGLKVPGMQIKNPACVKKTFPNFFQKLASPPPGGLGVRILDGQTRRELPPGDLFAD